jgi:hypothetical protein
MSMAFNDQGQFPPGIYASPARSGSSRRFLILAGLLLVMALICFLLLQADLAFPGLYFWFIGGDLMQFWFIVLLILGFVYLGFSGARTRSSTRGLRQGSAAYPPGYYPGYLGSVAARQPRRASASLLLRLPLVLLLVFLIYYFFIQGYTFRIQPHPTIMSDCNGGSFTVEGNATADTVSLKAGLSTIEGYGNYDQASNTLNLNGNLCGFTLSVPANSNLHLSGNDAELSVTGVKGKLELDDNAGNITINQSCLLDGSTVDNNAGTITITHSTLSPQAKVTSNGSPINIVASPTSEGCSG